MVVTLALLLLAKACPPRRTAEILGCIIVSTATENTTRSVADTKEIKIADTLFCKDKLICPRNEACATDLIKSTVRLSGKN